jgi:hypothetical protein
VPAVADMSEETLSRDEVRPELSGAGGAAAAAADGSGAGAGAAGAAGAAAAADASGAGADASGAGAAGAERRGAKPRAGSRFPRPDPLEPAWE